MVLLPSFHVSKRSSLSFFVFCLNFSGSSFFWTDVNSSNFFVFKIVKEKKISGRRKQDNWRCGKKQKILTNTRLLQSWHYFHLSCHEGHSYLFIFIVFLSLLGHPNIVTRFWFHMLRPHSDTTAVCPTKDAT